MASLSQLIATHGSILLSDAVSLRVQVGLLRRDQPALWHETDDEAGRGLFCAAETLLGKAGLGLGDIEAFVFCEGPGSMLGTRTIAMALRTWLILRPRPVFAYQSLALAAAAEWHRQSRPFSVIADARRECWHTLTVAGDGALSAVTRYPTASLPPGELMMPTGFRVWSEPPTTLGSCSYDLAELTRTVPDADLFQSVESPDAMRHEVPDYKKWSAEPHSAATVARP